MNTITVNTFNTPALIIKLTDIHVDYSTFRFTLNLETSLDGIIWSVPQPLAGTITLELKQWLTLIKDEKVKVVADNERGFEYIKSGRRLTTFQRYLEKIGFASLATSAGNLCEMEFQSHNNSEDYLANPFRLVQRLDGKCTLTLVNLPSKKRIETVNEETGEHTVHYSTKYGKFADGRSTKAFIAPSKFRRYIVEEAVERQLFTEPVVTE